MPLYEIPGPNGKVYQIEGPEGASRDDIINAITSQHEDFAAPTPPPPAEPIPQEKEYAGFFESLGGGISDTLGIADVGLSATLPGGDTGVEALEEFNADQAANPRTRFSFADIEKAYDEGGVEGTMELFKQLPGGFGEAIGMIFPSLASGATGAAIGSIIPGVGTVVGGIIGAALGSFFPQFGGNISEQANEDIKAGRPVDIETAKAALATVPQVALDLIGLKASGLTRLIGIEKKLPPGALRKKIAEEGLTKASAKGFVRIAGSEVPTEIGQEIITKIQAGADPFSEEAIAEYKEVAALTTLTGGLAPISAVKARSDARTDIKAEEVQKKLDTDAALNSLLPNRAMFDAAQKDANPVQAALEVAVEAENSLDNNAPEKSKLRKIIAKAQNELNDSITKQTVETQKKAVDTLLKDTQNLLKNFYKENKNVKATVTPGVLDKTTLTSFGLNPNSKAFKRLTHLNLNKPNNTKLFLDTLDKHTGKINEQVINDFTASIEESNPNVKYNFNKESQSSTNTGGTSVFSSRRAGEKADAERTTAPDGERVVNNLSTAPGPRARKRNVDDTLTEDVRKQIVNFIKVDPTKSYTPTTLKRALSGAGIKINPAQLKTLINQLPVLAGVDVTSQVKNNKTVQKIQATPEKVKAPVNPLQAVINDVNKKAPQTPVVEEQVVKEQVVKEQVEKPAAPTIGTNVPIIQTSDQTVEYIGKRPKGVTFTQITEDTGSTPEQIDALVSKGLIEVSTNENNERIALPTELNRDKTKLRKIISRLSIRRSENEDFILEAQDDFNTPIDIKNYIEEGNERIKDQKIGKPKAELSEQQERKAQQKIEEQLLIDLGLESNDAKSLAKKYAKEDLADFNPKTQDFHTAGNPNYVQRPDQINRFKGVKNLKRALQILKSEYGNVLGEVETVLLDTMLKVPNLQTTGFSIEQVRTRDGGGAYGAYTADTNNVRIHPNANIGTIIHEALHAVQAKKMNDAFTRSGKPKNEAGRYINKIYERAQAAANGRFDRELNNVFEFVNYALQDVQFQRFLSETAPLNPKNNLNSLWSDLVTAIKRLFNFSTNVPNSLLNDYLVVAQDLLDGPPNRIVGSDPLYNKPRENETKEEFRERKFDVKTNSDGVFKRIVKGIFRRPTAVDYPDKSLSGLFIRARTHFANSSAAIQEEAQTRSFNKVVNDSLSQRARTDIIMDATLQSNAIAASAADMGFVIIQENGMPKIIQDSATLKGVFNQVTKLADKVGVKEANKMVQEYLIGRRLQGEQQLNENRDRRISELENEKSNTKNKSERIKITKKINNIKNAEKTKMSDDDMRVLADKDYLVSEQQHPELKTISNMLNQIQQHNIDLLEATGVYSKEKADVFRSRDWYVPLHKTLDELEASQNGIKEFFKGYTDIGQEFKYKGGSDKQVDNVLDNFVMKHFWSVNAALRNHGNQEASSFVGMRNKEKIAALEAEAKVGKGLDEKQRKQLERIRDENPDDLVTYKNQADIPSGRVGYTAEVLFDGERVFVDYSDPGFAIAVRGPEQPLVDTHVPAALATLLRQTITANPIFQGYQVFNDSISAAAYSGVKNPFQLAKRVLSSYTEIINDPDSPIIQQMRRAGVTGGYGLTADEIIGKTRREFNLLPESKARAAAAYFEDLATHSDLAQRKAIYEQTLLETGGVEQSDGTIVGGNEIEAVNKAINIINWNKRGNSAGLRLLTHTIPFLNAYLQGMDILTNVMRGKFLTATDKKNALKLFAITSAKIMVLNAIYAAIVGGNDEYEELTDSEKLRSYIIPGTGMKLPLRGELAFLFKLLPEGLYNLVTKEGTEQEIDGRRVRQAVSESLAGGLLFPALFPQAIKAPIEVAMNYNLFTGNPIVSPFQERKETDLQVNAGTSYLARGFGEIGVSPLKVDHLLRGTFGTLGSVGLGIIDGIINQFVDNPLPSTPIDKMPGISAIMYSPNGRSALNQFYDLKDLSDRVTNSQGKYKGERLTKYLNDNAKLIGARDTINALNDAIKELRAERTEVIDNKNFSAKVKATKLRGIEKRMNKILKPVSSIRLQADLPLFSTQ